MEAKAPKDAGETRRFVYELRVGYGDTDQSGIAHHGVYPRWFEDARVAWLREEGGLSLAQIERERRIGFAVHSLQIQYKRPALFEDALQVELWIGALRRASLRFDYALKRGDEVLATAQVVLACLDLERLRACALPDDLRRLMQPAAAALAP